MKKIPFVNVSSDAKLASLPPDGRYATISHNLGRSFFSNTFPWRTTIYEVNRGAVYERGSGSNAGDVLSRFDDVVKVFLVGLDSANQVELNKKLAEFDIELIPDPEVEAEAKRAQDSLGPGFHMPV